MAPKNPNQPTEQQLLAQITELEMQRDEQATWLRRVLSAVPALIGHVDRDLRIGSINRKVAGYENIDVVGKSMLDYIDPRYHDVARDCVRSPSVGSRPSRCRATSVLTPRVKSWPSVFVVA